MIRRAIRRVLSPTASGFPYVQSYNHHEDFFRFTRGRFVAREAEQMAQRYIRFNVDELCKIAGEAVGKKCVQVEKCADGMYNKALLLSMDDETQVVAKIPNPNAGQPHLTTASEVATMDFMRNNLNVPVPRVPTWSSQATTAVGAEYIIMEKAPGVQLQAMWPSLNIEQRAEVIRSIALHLIAWGRKSFSCIGSIYYADDVPAESRRPLSYVDKVTSKTVDLPRFSMGPIQGREWVDLGRASLACDRGPWISSQQYRHALIEKEMQAIREVEQLPKPLSMLCGPGLYQPTRSKKLRASELALQALPHIMPAAHWASTFHVWHNDLHLENIFVDPKDPSAILSIIDWQSVHITPLFDLSIWPCFLNDLPIVESMERPVHQEPPEGASTEEKDKAWQDFEAESLSFGFRQVLHNKIKPAFEALVYGESAESTVLTLSRRLLEVGETHCMAAISELPGSPIAMSPAEKAEIEADKTKVDRSVQVMHAIEKYLGSLFPDRGVVRHEEYDDSKAALRDAKSQIMDDFSESPEDRALWEEAWPFDD